MSTKLYVIFNLLLKITYNNILIISIYYQLII